MSRKEPLAIVGVACRLPGGLDNPEIFWDAIINRKSLIGSVPKERWNSERFFAESDDASGKTYMKKGGFLKQDIRRFDANFFGMSPREAEYIDPQQRLLLEVAWEALENAGIDPVDYIGREVGVYVGGFTLDHMLNQLGASNRPFIGSHSAAGSTMTMLSNRISHAFDFRGPSISIDTACSSSLVATHYGCQDLWAGRCEMAVVGGVNVMIRPEYPIAMSKGKFLARDGHCKSFDSRADGYSRGEGAGIVIVKPLAKALADGDTVWAQIEATGVNQDGRTNGITVPSGDAQKALMRKVTADAGIDPARVRYVEAHGTGTALGDPTEAGAIGSVYGQSRSAGDACVIGSVKSNIGHLEAAAGVAGLIKTVLCLKHNAIPPLATLIEPNPAIPFNDLGLQLADRLMPMTEADDDGDVYAAINSFGYGGTNAHIVLRRPAGTLRAEDAPEEAAGQEDAGNTRTFPHILPVSARSDGALAELAQAYRERLADSSTALDDVVFSAARRRSHGPQRLAVLGNDRDELIAALDTFAAGTADHRVATGTKPYQGQRLPVFVYTGMGPQWWGMGQELWRTHSVYREAVAEADEAFRTISGFSILEEMLRGENASRITETQFAQPANFMVQVGLTAVLKAAGVVPGAVVGHSVGEVTASYASGILSLEDALTVSFHRSRVQKKAAGTGGMLAVGVSLDDAERLIEGREHLVSIAAINGPSTLTLSGDVETLREISAILDERGAFNRPLQVEVPYHSPMMAPLREELEEALAVLNPSLPTTATWSTVTGARVEGRAYDGPYWTKNIREPVYFAKAIESLLAEGYGTFVEVGPHPVLSASLRECFNAAKATAKSIETLRRNEPEKPRVHSTIAQVYASGCDLDWNRLYPTGRLAPLPNYPWQREVLWHEGAQANQDRLAENEGPLLGVRRSGAVELWESDLATANLAYLTDHVIDGLPILPAAAFIEAALEVARRLHPEAQGVALRTMSIERALPLNPQTPVSLSVGYQPETRTVVLKSQDASRLHEATRHAAARLYPVADEPVDRIDLASLAADWTPITDIAGLYARFAERGLQYGPLFQTIKALSIAPGHDQMLVRLELDESEGPAHDRYLVHPTLLDGCFQALLALLAGEKANTAYLPTSIKELRLSAALPKTAWCRGTMARLSDREISCDLELIDPDGRIIAVLTDLRCTALSGARSDGAAIPHGNYRYAWLASDRVLPAVRTGPWLIVGDRHRALAAATSEHMTSLGAHIAGTVGFGDACSGDGTDFTVRPGVVADAVEMLRAVGPLSGIAVFHPVDCLKDDDPTGEEAIASLMALLQAVNEIEPALRPRVYVVTRGAAAAGPADRSVFASQGAITGFARVAFNELEGVRCTTVDLGVMVDDPVLEALAEELLADAEEDEIALRREGRFTAELQNTEHLHESRSVELAAGEPCCVAVEPAATDGVPMVRESLRRPLKATEVEVHMEAAAIAPAALWPDGHESVDRLMEFVGSVVAVGQEVTDLIAGMRICGSAPVRLGTYVRLERETVLAVEISPAVRGIDAAAGLLLHADAACLVDRAALSADDHVLVWSDATGMALAQMATRVGARVVLMDDAASTVASEEFAAGAHYPRSARALHQAVREQTGGVGFSVIAAPLTKWADQFDFSALAEGGRLIDTGAVAKPVALEAHVGAVYRRDPASALTRRRKALVRAARVCRDLMERGELNGPAPATVHVADIAKMTADAVADLDRVVVRFNDDGRAITALAGDQVAVTPDASYLVTGGFGGLGREIARWLVAHGARHLVLVGRKGAADEGSRAFVRELEEEGVTVMSAACDIADRAQTAAFLDTVAETLPPLRGIMHTAAVLDDRPISEMDRDSLARVMAAKATGAWNLHQLTEDEPLDFFVLFSSISALVGNSRQANYVAANAFLDALAWHRHLRHLPALSLNWGAISDAGIVTRNDRLEQHLKSIGLTAFPVQEALAGLERAMARDVVQLCLSRPADWSQWAHYETLGATSPRFLKLIYEATGNKDESALVRLVNQLEQIDAEHRQEMLAMLIAEVVAAELKLPAESVAVDRPMTALGVDSLMALEIQMVMEMTLGLKVSTLELIGDNTILALAGKFLETTGLAGEVSLAAAE